MHTRMTLSILLLAACWQPLAATGACADAAVMPASSTGVLTWVTDIEAAKRKAAKEGKDLLIDFTGSDWCGWCKRLKAEVFDKPAFTSKASKRFIFVEVDFPRRKQQLPAVKAANQKLAQSFGVRGFPTIVLADAQGRGYARTGYKPGGAQAYLKHLDQLRAIRVQRDQNLAKAAKAQGVAKARYLNAAIAPILQSGALIGYDEQVREIVAADADNQAGLKAKYYPITLWPKLRAPGADIAAISAELDNFMQKYPTKDGAAQELLFLRSFCSMRLGDRAGMAKYLREAKAAAPQSARARIIDKLLQQLATPGGQPGGKTPAGGGGK